MGRLKWRNFKGLYTNIDASDKGAEYFSKFKDIKVYPGYIESKGLKFEDQAYGLPEGHTFIRQQYVFLDEDKYQNIKVGGDISPFTCDRDDIIIDSNSRETSGQGHTYTIELVPQPAGLPDETSYFRWKIGGQFSDPIPINYEIDYTQVWFEVANGLKIKFKKYWYGIPTPQIVWIIKSEVSEVTELRNNYVQNIQKHLFQISHLNGNYHFFIDGEEVNNSPFADSPHQYPKIINEKGILKVLMKKQALWIGKVNRSYWTKESNNVRTATIEGGFYIYPIVETLNNQRPLFNFIIETEDTIPETIPAIARVKNLRSPLDYLGYTYDVTVVKFYKTLDDKYIYFPDIGYLPVYKIYDNFGNIGYAFWEGYVTKFFPGQYPDFFRVGSLGDSKILLYNGQQIPHQFGEERFVVMEQPLEQYFDGVRVFNLDAGNMAFSGSVAFDGGEDIELLTTIMTSDGEYPINYIKAGSESKNFVVAIEWNSVNIKEFYKNKITANVYFRYKYNPTSETITDDFELAYTTIFVSGEDKNDYAYINKLTPNGIMLTQTIGKYFDPLTYKIITAFDDYANVAGIPYILKNSNVHFPAVGGGSILNNFYYENVVPGIEGERLIALTNLLGVFSGTKELMTLIDFSPVESSMIFYIKDTLQYRIRDEKDIAETPEGTFIHLKEGIYVTNGRERTLISEPINDLVRKHYKNASIFYNSYWKQLYYYTGTNLYCFDFETQSWCEYSLPKDWDKNNLIDFIEDFEGRIFFIAKDKSYQLEFESKEGILELSYLDLQEYSIGKRINYLVADHTGEIKAIDVTANGATRAIRYLFNKLDNRKPLRNITVEIKFNGTIYGIEMDIETMRIEQL